MHSLSQRDHLHIRMTVPSAAGVRYLLRAIDKDPALVISAAFACGHHGLSMFAWCSAARTVWEALEALTMTGRIVWDHWHCEAGEWVIAAGGGTAAFGQCEYASNWIPHSIREEMHTPGNRIMQWDRPL